LQEERVEVLFVHGMGRSPLSGWPLMWHLKRGGLKTSTFGYIVSVEDFPAIKRRLAARIARMAARGEYVVIGHSLGGVLLRAAVNSLPPGTRLPRHTFLLGSPIRPSRLAQRLGRNPVYRMLTRDCGQLLGSLQRMSEIGSIAAPVTGIVGVRRAPWGRSPFGDESNDGVVSLTEVSAEWIREQVEVPTIHTLLPSSRRVAEIILERLAPRAGPPA
jgi:hypothetical protein